MFLQARLLSPLTCSPPPPLRSVLNASATARFRFPLPLINGPISLHEQICGGREFQPLEAAVTLTRSYSGGSGSPSSADLLASHLQALFEGGIGSFAPFDQGGRQTDKTPSYRCGNTGNAVTQTRDLTPAFCVSRRARVTMPNHVSFNLGFFY